MAGEFLSHGCSVVVSGRMGSVVDTTARLLAAEHPGAFVRGFPCDTGNSAQVQALWDAAVEAMGGVDHWISNAGIGQPMLPIWELPPAEMESIVRTDLLGVLYGARAAMHGMTAQGSGAIWFMEGHGSDGRIMKGLSVYGTAKRAVRYAAHALAVEARGTGVLVGTLSPGIMITDFTMSQVNRAGQEERERTKKIFNILADKPETVARFLVPRILSTPKSGAHIAWLTGRKIFFRFMTAGMTRRNVIDD
jgi:NAD(P)-dependent dehydrogenase (short-subunit alcohol dehydrogenase family)